MRREGDAELGSSVVFWNPEKLLQVAAIKNAALLCFGDGGSVPVCKIV
jgi:hypothetical protein